MKTRSVQSVRRRLRSTVARLSSATVREVLINLIEQKTDSELETLWGNAVWGSAVKAVKKEQAE